MSLGRLQSAFLTPDSPDAPPRVLIAGVTLAWDRRVARMSRTLSDGTYHVIVHGKLTRADLKRLERVCGPALEQRELPLEIHLEEATGFDEAALFFLDRLRSRGAVVSVGAEAAAVQAPGVEAGSD